MGRVYEGRQCDDPEPKANRKESAMAGFRKAKAEQAAVKMGIYGPAGSGKTFTALLLAEGLANITKKRIAYVDTERGTDFYCQPVPDRAVHPDAFDFDAMYTRSIVDINKEVAALDTDVYGVLILDSMSHVWDACKERPRRSGPSR
jgi:Mrp family chromosome partitioning ATPase